MEHGDAAAAAQERVGGCRVAMSVGEEVLHVCWLLPGGLHPASASLSYRSDRCSDYTLHRLVSPSSENL